MYHNDYFFHGNDKVTVKFYDTSKKQVGQTVHQCVDDHETMDFESDYFFDPQNVAYADITTDGNGKLMIDEARLNKYKYNMLKSQKKDWVRFGHKNDDHVFCLWKDASHKRQFGIKECGKTIRFVVQDVARYHTWYKRGYMYYV